MENYKIEKGAQINAGSHVVSIGTYKIGEVAIISRNSGDFSQIKFAGRKLKKIKRKFKSYLNSEETFTFSHMTPERTKELIKLLRR